MNKQWRKSSHSHKNGDCIELTTTNDEIRDSKDPHGPTLKVDTTALIRAVKAGRFEGRS